VYSFSYSTNALKDFGDYHLRLVYRRMPKILPYMIVRINYSFMSSGSVIGSEEQIKKKSHESMITSTLGYSFQADQIMCAGAYPCSPIS